MSWALAIKTKLGNVYHLTRDDGSAGAKCDRRINLELQKYETPPLDGYLCARCRSLNQGTKSTAHGNPVEQA